MTKWTLDLCLNCNFLFYSLMDSFVPFGGFFSSQSDLKAPLNSSFYCVPHCHQCGERCEHEVLAASKERFCASSAADPHQSSLPPWLQIAEFGSTKGLNVKVCSIQIQQSNSL